MFRHTAFFMFKEDVTPERHLAMLKGLAYMRFECESVRALDYGTDLLGGSRALREVKPWDRTPRWRAEEQGPPCNYDVALMLDFANAAGNEAYNEDDVHHEVAVYNALVCRGELTARVDWEYEGEPLIRRGHVRHSAMFVWRDGVDDAAKEAARDRVRELGAESGVDAVTIGDGVGKLKTDFDWIMDVQVADQAAAEALIASEAYARAMAAVAPLTKYEWTARMTHAMRGI